MGSNTLDPVVGTLSTRGWATTPEEMCRELLNHYTESGYSQSVIYYGNIRSYAKALQRHSQNYSDLKSQVVEDLTAIFSPYFPEKVMVNVKTVPKTKGSAVNVIYMEVAVVKDGETYNASDYADIES